MFTGIIEEVGEVIQAGSGLLRIRAPLVLSDAKLGDSIAINGVDLTVAEMDGDSFSANVMPETYRRSNLGQLKAGDRVNLERSVRPTDRLSGHIVRGVVEGMATVESFTPESDAVIARFRTPVELLRYMVVKGPVAIDGASRRSSTRLPPVSRFRWCSTRRSPPTSSRRSPATRSTSRRTSLPATSRPSYRSAARRSADTAAVGAALSPARDIFASRRN